MASRFRGVRVIELVDQDEAARLVGEGGERMRVIRVRVRVKVRIRFAFLDENSCWQLMSSYSWTARESEVVLMLLHGMCSWKPQRGRGVARRSGGWG